MTYEYMDKIVLEMFNNDPDWKDIVKGKSIDYIKETWRSDYNIACCLANEPAGLTAD